MADLRYSAGVAPWNRRRLIFVLGAIAFACQVYDSSLLTKQQPGSSVPESEWGSGIGWWSKKLAGNCISAGVPTVNDRPKNASGNDVSALYFAVRDMALGSLDRNGAPTQDAWKSLGFDLDGVCTNSENCEDQGPSCRNLGSVEDGKACRDNTFGRLEATAVAQPEIGKTVGLSNDGFNCSLCYGIYNFVIKLSEWNGQPDDSNVRVDFYPSPGLENPLPYTCDINAPLGDWKKNPCWTKSDKWTIENGSFTGTITDALPPATLNDPSAYVRQGYIVGQLPADTLLWFPGEAAVRAYPLKIQQGLFAGKLAKKSDGGWQIVDGTIAGRAKKEDLVYGFEQMGFCEGHPLYATMLVSITTFLDILASGANSPEASCDALSVGIGFTADEASFSTTPADVVPLPGCPVTTDGGTDAAADSGSSGEGGNSGTGGSTDAGSD